MEKVIRLNDGVLCCEPFNIYEGTDQEIFDGHHIFVSDGMIKPDFAEFGYSYEEEEYFINSVYDADEKNEREYAIELQEELPYIELNGAIDPRIDKEEIVNLILEDLTTGKIKLTRIFDEITINFSHEKCKFNLEASTEILPEFEEPEEQF